MTEPATINALAASLPLADIHLQPAPGYWPPGWGWWLCLLATFAVLAYGITKLRQHRNRQLARREAMQQLRQLNSPARFNEINLLLRQAAMSYYPRRHVAGLTGGDWLAFLDSHLAEKHSGFVALSDSWQQGLFSPRGLEQPVFDKCYRQAALWLKKARLPAREKLNPGTKEVNNA